MKKLILYRIILMMLFSSSLGANAQCANINGDFETYIGTPSFTTEWYNDSLTRWYISHGHSHFFITPDPEVFLFAQIDFFDSIPKGSGTYTDFNFISGHTYTLSYDLKWDTPTHNPITDFHVELTNGLTPEASPLSGIIPTPSGTQRVSDKDYSYTGSWTTITETFVASNNYSQLWFYPILEDTDSLFMFAPYYAACLLDNICVNEVITDSCGVSVSFDFNADPEWCSSTFINTSAYPLTDGFELLKTIWDFGDGTTGSGDSLSHYYTSPGFYDICMTIWTTNGDDCCQTSIYKTIEITEICEACHIMLFAELDVIGGNPFTFNANISPSFHNHLYGYYWDFGDGTSGSGKTVNHPFVIPGNYTVTLTVYYFDENTGECCSYDVSVIVNAAELPIDDDGGDDGEWAPLIDDGGKVILNTIQPSGALNVYPNPSTGVFTLLPNDNIAIDDVTVYDNTGKIVYNSQNKSENRLFELDLNHLETGIYLLVINKDNPETKIHKKLMVK